MQRQTHGKSLRVGRFSQAGHVYLMTCVTKERQPVFTDFYIARMLVNELRRLHESATVCSLAWVIMPDHLHWLFELRSGSLATVAQAVKGRSSFEINKACGSKVLAWQRGYHDRAARAEEDLVKMSRYVIANPIRAGLVETEGDYPLWDSVWT